MDLRMLKINSSSNEKTKFVKKLRLKKYRQKFQMFALENFKIIKDAAGSGYLPEILMVTEDFIKKNFNDLQKILSKNKLGEHYLINSGVNKNLSELEQASGVVAVYRMKRLPVDYESSVLYLENISDPGNLGNIIRNALAFDMNNIIVQECADVYNSKTISAAKDAIFKVNLGVDKNYQLLEKLHQKMPLIATSLKGKQLLADFHPKESFCLILGSESHGVSPVIKKSADQMIKIKISSMIESLNVASAAAIVLNHVYQQKKQK